VVIKTRYSGFYNTDLHHILQDKHIDVLLITGYATDVCVRMTVVDAYNRDYRLFLVEDCVAPYRKDPITSVEYLRALTNLTVIHFQDIPKIFSRGF